MSQPQRFRPYDRPDDDAGPDSKTRRINSADKQQPPAGDEAWQDMVGTSSWRAERGRVATNRTTGRIPVNQQRMSMWLSNGGWKIVGGAGAVLLVLLIVVLVNNRPGTSTDGTPTPGPSSNIINDGNAPPIVTQDPNQVATQPPLDQPTTPPETGGGPRFAVTGTGTEGLFLRDNPGGNILKTMPEGTLVEKIGEQSDANGTLWFNIREPGGMEGWSSSAFLIQQ